jgi:hypothetical protein
MKRRRWLFNFAAAVSGVVLVASISLWVRTWFASDIVERLDSYPSIAAPLGKRQITIASYGASLLVEIRYLDWRGPIGHPFKWYRLPAERGYVEAVNWPAASPTQRRIYAPIGFSLLTEELPGMPRSRALSIPIWGLAALAAVLPVVWLIRWWRSGQAAPNGCCENCGYDLRATPTRCPECGAIPGLKSDAHTSRSR